MKVTKYFDNQYLLSCNGILWFEIKSFFGRRLYNKPPKISKNCKNYLHLGCGDSYIKGFINADFFSILRILKKGVKKTDWMLDFRYPLNCPNNVWNGIFTEHTLEHLYPWEVHKLLKELYRTMKYGAVIRITLPDLKKYIDFYSKNFKNINKAYFQKQHTLGAEAIRDLTQNYFHRSVWDAQLLAEIMKDVGFRNIEEEKFKDGKNKFLLIEKKERRWNTLYMEGIK